MVDTIIDFETARIDLAYAPPKRQPIVREEPLPYAELRVLEVLGAYFLLVNRADGHGVPHIPLPIPKKALVEYRRMVRKAAGQKVTIENRTKASDETFGIQGLTSLKKGA